jgi:SAM-dependent methyltransferase
VTRDQTNAGSPVLHADARRLDDSTYETPAASWSYTVSFPVEPLQPGERLIVAADLEVLEGRVAVGCLSAADESFVAERVATGGTPAVRLSGSGGIRAVMFRNASERGASRFRIRSLEVRRVTGAAYPVDLSPRDLANEPIPEGGTKVFNDELAQGINVARMAFVRSLGLPLHGRRVLDVGCGVGHFGRMYASLGATVVGLDGREDNIRDMKERYPEIEGHVGDIQTMPLEALGTFDLVHCFGLLYHLESPIAALRRMEAVCRDLLLLETMVCDASRPVMVLADETKDANQALAGMGSRPSPSFVVMALNRVGFPFVYGAARPPAHPDFLFDWRDNLDVARDGYNLRCVLVASRRALDLGGLTPLLES